LKSFRSKIRLCKNRIGLCRNTTEDVIGNDGAAKIGS